MILDIIFGDHHTTREDFTRYSRVCHLWNKRISRFLTPRLPPEIQYMIVREMLMDPDISVHDIITISEVSRSWVKYFELTFRRYKYARAMLLHVAVRENKIEAAEQLMSQADVRMAIPEAAENLDYEAVWTVLHTACFYDRIDMIRLLVERLGALQGRCRHYVADLILIAVNEGNVDTWSALGGYLDEVTEAEERGEVTCDCVPVNTA
jgi:hypothetical protein